MLRFRCAAVALVLAAAHAACGDSAGPRVSPGVYTATVVAPAGNLDGAAVLELNGSGIEDVTATDATLFLERKPDRVRVVVIRDVPGTMRLSVRLAASRSLPRGTVLEVADGDDQLRSSLAGYSVRFE